MQKRTTILMDSDLLERLDRFAARGAVTKTAVLAAAVESYLETHDTAPDLSFLAVGRSDHGRLSIDGRSISRREAGVRPGPDEA
jgi:predicted transcriptional regulator